MYLFQFHMPLILCTSAIISPALVLCVKQAAAVNLHLSNAVFFTHCLRWPPKTSYHTACCSQPAWEAEEDLQCFSASFPLSLSSHLPRMGITCLCCWSWPLRTAGHSCTKDGISLILQWKTSSYCPLDSCIWKSISFITVMFAIVSLCRRVWWGNIRWCPLLCEKSDLCQLHPINCLADQVYNHWSIIKN